LVKNTHNGATRSKSVASAIDGCSIGLSEIMKALNFVG
jgi:hypothetical protein